MAYNYEWPYTDPNRYNDDWLLSSMKDLLARMDSMEEWKAEYERAYEDFKKLVADVEKGNFPESIRNAFYNWMKENALDLVGSLVKSVYFGLTDAGYFVAYIPESWKDIIFKTTGKDIILEMMPEYGHLVLQY